MHKQTIFLQILQRLSLAYFTWSILEYFVSNASLPFLFEVFELKEKGHQKKNNQKSVYMRNQYKTIKKRSKVPEKGISHERALNF